MTTTTTVFTATLSIAPSIVSFSIPNAPIMSSATMFLSILPPPQKSLLCRQVVALMPPPLILLTLPPPLNTQPWPIDAPSPLVCWRLSSHLSLVCRLVVALPVVACLRLAYLSLRSCRTHPSSTPPLCSRQLVAASHLFAMPPPLDAPLPHNWLCRRRRRCAGIFVIVAIAMVTLVTSRRAGVIALVIVVVDVRRHCR